MLLFALLIALVVWLVANLPAVPYGWDAIAAVAALLSPLLLQRAPKAWKGKPMVVIAGATAAACGLVGMLLQGQFNHFDPALAATYLLALMGIASKFYDLFKDDLHLADPPSPAAAAAAAPVPPPKVV